MVANALEAERLLVARLQSPSRAGQDAAFSELFHTYREPVFRLCHHLLGHQADAADATQETFFEVSRAIAGYRGDARLFTWIYRITVRTALRVRSRRGPPTAPLNPDALGGATVVPTLAREQAERLTRAIAELSAEHQTVLSLFALEDLSHEQIAAVLGIPVGTVWSRLHGARKKLTTLLDRER